MDPSADGDSAIVVHAQLEPAAYRRALVILAVFRLRLVAPILAFFTFGALAAGRYEQALFLGTSLLGIGLIIWLWASWQAHSPANQEIYDATEYRFTDEHIGFTSGGVNGEIPWSSIKRWRYISSHYLLHMTSASFLAIPVGGVASEDIGALEALFKEKIAKGSRGSVR